MYHAEWVDDNDPNHPLTGTFATPDDVCQWARQLDDFDPQDVLAACRHPQGEADAPNSRLYVATDRL